MTDLWFLTAETNADIPVSVVMSVLVTDALTLVRIFTSLI